MGTYFCEAYSSESESYSEKFAFKSTDTGSGTAAMALAWKQLVGENKTDFLFHVDGVVAIYRYNFKEAKLYLNVDKGRPNLCS